MHKPFHFFLVLIILLILIFRDLGEQVSVLVFFLLVLLSEYARVAVGSIVTVDIIVLLRLDDLFVYTLVVIFDNTVR